MLSVVIETDDDEEALARTLASLVTGAVEGAVREVIICDRAGNAATRNIADLTGCHYLPEASISKGLALARSDWVLLLEPGVRLLEGWVDAVLIHVNEATRPARFTRSRRSPPSLLERLLWPKRRLLDGLVITRAEALVLAAKAENGEAIARRISPQRLAAEILIAPARA